MNTIQSFSGLALSMALAIIPLAAKADTFTVDRSKSSIQVDVKATGHDFTGTLTNYTTKISGDAGALVPGKVELKWDFKDLLTGDRKRDHEMLKWLEHPKFGTGTFTLTSFGKAKDGTPVAKGTLTFHGVSKTIQFPVKTNRSGKNLTVSGTVRIDHQDFKLDKIRKVLVLTVDPVVTVRFNLVGVTN